MRIAQPQRSWLGEDITRPGREVKFYQTVPISRSFVGSTVDGDVPKETDMREIPLHNDPPKETSLRHGLMDERAKGQLPSTALVLAKAGEDQTLTGEGVYVGEGLSPVPPKLAKKIRSGEFVEMEKLLLEICTRGDVELEAKRHLRCAHDIFTWLQCFGVYASVRGSHSLAMIPN